MTSARIARRISSALAPVCLVLLVGCGDDDSTTFTTSGSTTSSSGTGGAGGAGGSTSSAGGAGGASSSSGTGGAPSIHSVTFTYTPGWSGVTGVEVAGDFSMGDNWNIASPLVELNNDGSGTFTATVDLPARSTPYPFLFRVRGDDDAPAGFKRFALDPTLPVAACPAGAPISETNPCSQLTVPQSPAPQLVHITGRVVYGGVPIEGYLVQVDSDEANLGSYFVNRVNSAADGTFDLQAATGLFRVQVLHPTYLTLTDADRDPLMLRALRRAISSTVYLSNPVSLLDAEMEYTDYDQLSPTPSATLPTTFQITLLPGAENARVAVYGTPGGTGTTIGNYWYWSPASMNTTVTFDGIFTGSSATEPAVVPGEQYYWGTYQYRPAGTGVNWNGQSMVLPIVWN